MYTPNPKDTSGIELDSSLTELTEMIARNVHEVWAKSRIEDGWTYGGKRDDIHKTSPCIVPYDELPESEKEYDRNTAIETLKLVISLGYRIEKTKEEQAP